MNQNPSLKHCTAHRYSPDFPENKKIAKLEMQKNLGWPAEPKRPLFCLPCGMAKELGGELLKETLPGILSLDIQLLIRGKGTKEYGELFTKLAQNHSHKIAIIPDEEEALIAMYSACDGAIFFADPSFNDELKLCLRFGVVPISPQCAKLETYDPIQESGCAFTFDTLSNWHCFAAVVCAIETFKFPFDWRTIQKHCMQSV